MCQLLKSQTVSVLNWSLYSKTFSFLPLLSVSLYELQSQYTIRNMTTHLCWSGLLHLRMCLHSVHQQTSCQPPGNRLLSSLQRNCHGKQTNYTFAEFMFRWSPQIRIRTDWVTCFCVQTPACCTGFYGPDCSPCPGGYQTPCSGHGQVHSTSAHSYQVLYTWWYLAMKALLSFVLYIFTIDVHYDVSFSFII